MSQAGSLGNTGGLPAVVELIGDQGTAIGPIITLSANNAANGSGASVKFVNSGSTSTLKLTDVNNNTFLGQSSGNLTVSANQSTGVGFQSLGSLTSGVQNTAIGVNSMQSMTTGDSNTAVGTFTLATSTSGRLNAAFGDGALGNNTGSQNTAIGTSSLQSTGNASNNTALGYAAGSANISGTQNTYIGIQTGNGIVSGSNNTMLGYQAGFNYSGAESNNLIIGANVGGTGGESNVTRIGSGQTQCYIAGVLNTNSGRVVNITSPGAYPYTTLISDDVIIVDTTAARTITPLANPVTGTRYTIKDNTGSAAANNITITPSGKNIDGMASYIINNNYGSATIVYNGTQWNLI